MIYRDRADDEHTIACVSSGRSGSTWLSQVVTDAQTRIIYEPMHAQKGVPGLKEYNLKYIREGDQQPELNQYLDQLFQGKCHSYWLDCHNPKWSWVLTRRLIKLIRANMMLGYMAERYPKAKFILLMRHPGAVALSQFSGGWRMDPKDIYAQMGDEFPIINALPQPANIFQNRLLWWVLENYLAALALGKPNVTLVFYEHFLLNLEQMSKHLSEFCNIDRAQMRLEDSDKPSSVSAAGLKYTDANERLKRWMDKVDVADREYLQLILEGSGMSRYYTADSALPILDVGASAS